MMPSDTPANN